MSVKQDFGSSVGCVFSLGYFCVALLQIAAVVSAFMYWFDADSHILGILLFLPAVLIGSIPIIGAIIGVLGAIQAWGWSVPAAIGLFVAPYLIGVVGYGIMRACGVEDV